MNKVFVAVLSAAVFFGVEVSSQAGQIDTTAKTWDFSMDQPGNPPAGFVFAKTGRGRPGRWVVIPAAQIKETGNILAQTDTDTTDYRFPMAIADSPVIGNIRLSVRCAPVAGNVDRACGIVFRYLDENNYYVARANALEDNIRVYRVKNGRREQFGTWDGKVGAGTWHELRVDARGDRFEIYWDGRKIIDARDGTFPGAGKIGVWTKADSVTYFKDLKLESFGP